MADESIEVLLARIQQHLDSHAGGRQHQTPHARGGAFSDAVYDALEEAKDTLADAHVDLLVTPSTVPLCGPLIQRLRGQAHALVVFYVNRLAGAQAIVNRAIVSSLTYLVRDLDFGGQADLRKEVEALRREMLELKAQLQTGPVGTPPQA